MRRFTTPTLTVSCPTCPSTPFSRAHMYLRPLAERDRPYRIRLQTILSTIRAEFCGRYQCPFPGFCLECWDLRSPGPPNVHFPTLQRFPGSTGLFVAHETDGAPQKWRNGDGFLPSPWLSPLEVVGRPSSVGRGATREGYLTCLSAPYGVTMRRWPLPRGTG